MIVFILKYCQNKKLQENKIYNLLITNNKKKH